MLLSVFAVLASAQFPQPTFPTPNFPESAFPTPDLNLPGGVPGMPGTMPGLPGTLPDLNLPGGMPGFPGGDFNLPGGMPGFPGGDFNLPGGMPGFPGGSMPGFPGGDFNLPGGMPGFPGGSMPGFPGGDFNLPGGMPGFPGGDFNLPGSMPGLPGAPGGAGGIALPNMKIDFALQNLLSEYKAGKSLEVAARNLGIKVSKNSVLVSVMADSNFNPQRWGMTDINEEKSGQLSLYTGYVAVDKIEKMSDDKSVNYIMAARLPGEVIHEIISIKLSPDLLAIVNCMKHFKEKCDVATIASENSLDYKNGSVLVYITTKNNAKPCVETNIVEEIPDKVDPTIKTFKGYVPVAKLEDLSNCADVDFVSGVVVTGIKLGICCILLLIIAALFTIYLIFFVYLRKREKEKVDKLWNLLALKRQKGEQ
ncbi:MAG: hypothetical protein QW400_01985 [Candidatus Diapherotrites archaeon]